MTNTPQSTQPQKQDNVSAVRTEQEKSATLNTEIKKTWDKLTDEDIKLYATQPEQFFGKVKEKYNLPKEEAQKRMSEIKTACGSCSSDKAA
jgi:uncharacterized protein YjbJ (UPF0337 family)